MYKNKKIVCVIPARLASTRFPRKMLATLGDRPLLEWVWQAATSVSVFDEVVFAVDDVELAALIAQFNGKSVMTSVDCKSGTDRLVELAVQNKYQADVWVNWQGDEPFVTESMIMQLLSTCDEEGVGMWTLKKMIQKPEDIFAPNTAKVVCDKQGNALYFSRSPIPFFRDEHDAQKLVHKQVYYKHVGLYAFTTESLHSIGSMGTSILEDAEKLEMLRLLSHGMCIRVHETDHEVFGIDTLNDLMKAERRIQGIIQ